MTKSGAGTENWTVGRRGTWRLGKRGRGDAGRRGLRDVGREDFETRGRGDAQGLEDLGGRDSRRRMFRKPDLARGLDSWC